MMNRLYKLGIASILTLSLLFPVTGVTAQSAATTSNTSRTIVVCLKGPLDDSTVFSYGGAIKRKHKNLPLETLTLTQSAIDKLKSNSNVTCLEDDFKMKVNTQTQDWGLAAVQAPTAWSNAYTGKGVKVAVIDTGIATHEDLVVSGGTSFVSYTTNYNDDQGHGTHVAGIIGAKNNNLGVVGVAPDASLYAVKVLGNDGSGYLSDVVAGIDWAISNGMNVINMSLGAPSGTLSMQQAIDRAYSAGILVMTAAGNSGNSLGTGDTVEYPAKYPSAIAVAAVDSSLRRASFSSTGSKVELAAPGVVILSTYINNQYASMSGTSMATPYASGIAALWKQAYPTLSAEQLRLKIQQTSKDLGSAGRDTQYGFGLIQAPTAPQSATPIPTSTPEPTATPIAPVTTTTPLPITNGITASIATKYDIYYRGETVGITTKAKLNKAALPGAIATLTLEIKGYAKLTATTPVDATGTANFNFFTSRHTPVGDYALTITFKKPGYTSGTATKTFKLK